MNGSGKDRRLEEGVGAAALEVGMEEDEEEQGEEDDEEALVEVRMVDECFCCPVLDGRLRRPRRLSICESRKNEGVGLEEGKASETSNNKYQRYIKDNTT